MVLILTLITVGVAAAGFGWYSDYQAGLQAGAALKTVRQAQLDYLAENPTNSYSDITGGRYTAFLQHLPGSALPTMPAYHGSAVGINVTVFPPVATMGGGTFDPSGSSTDGLWDSGP